jgi:predicted ATPase
MFTSLRLERFKNFKDAELKLGPFSVLIGANASGKSNVRDAFRFLHGIGRGYSLAEIIGEKYGEGGERVWTGIRGGIPEIAYSGSRSFALTVPGYDKFGNQITYQIEINIDRKRVISSVAFERFRIEHPGNELVGKATKGNLELHYRSAEGLDQKLRDVTGDRPFIYRLAHPTGGGPPISLNSYEAAQTLSDSSNITDMLHSMRFFDWALDAIRQPSPAGQDVLSDNGRNLSSVLQAICRDGQGKRNLLAWITELTPMDAVDFEFPADPTGKVLATLVEKNGQRITLASASDGTLRFLAFLAAFLGPHPSRFYFFEELENGIHPTRLGLLLDLVENQVKNKGIQVVATTHSPQLLGHLSEKSLENAHLVYRLPDEPDARIIRVLDMPHAGDVITMNRLAHLLATGWFETTAYFMQPDPDDEKVASRPVRRRKSKVS